MAAQPDVVNAAPVDEAAFQALPAVPEETRRAVEELLGHEAALLSERAYEDWLALFTPDVRYRAPLRVSRRRGSEFDPVMAHFDETHATLAMRVRRLVASDSVWAEDPPSRVRYFVSGVRVRALGGQGLLARSNLMVVRTRGDVTAHDQVTGERQDLIRETPQGLRIARRLVLLDHTALAVHNLSFFL